MARIRYALETVTFWAKESPVRFLLWIGLFDATFTAVAYVITAEVTSDRALIVGAAVLTGILVALGLLLVWAFITAARRDLQIRVGTLEEEMEAQKEQMASFMQDKFGEPLQFLPIYHELRTDVREAIRIIERSRDTGKLWKRTHPPDAGKWKKHKDSIANNPWARLDNLYGPLLEAFDHIETLVTQTAWRFGTSGRKVRATDDLDPALSALKNAEERLTFSIDRLEKIQGIRDESEAEDQD